PDGASRPGFSAPWPGLRDSTIPVAWRREQKRDFSIPRSFASKSVALLLSCRTTTADCKPASSRDRRLPEGIRAWRFSCRKSNREVPPNQPYFQSHSGHQTAAPTLTPTDNKGSCEPGFSAPRREGL